MELLFYQIAEAVRNRTALGFLIVHSRSIKTRTVRASRVADGVHHIDGDHPTNVMAKTVADLLVERLISGRAFGIVGLGTQGRGRDVLTPSPCDWDYAVRA